MKKATIKKIILSVILFNMILVFTACGLCNKPAFVGDEIADTDFYDVAFEQMNSTHSHNLEPFGNCVGIKKFSFRRYSIGVLSCLLSNKNSS